jgi:hypothetical protein
MIPPSVYRSDPKPDATERAKLENYTQKFGKTKDRKIFVFLKKFFNSFVAHAVNVISGKKNILDLFDLVLLSFRDSQSERIRGVEDSSYPWLQSPFVL